MFIKVKFVQLYLESGDEVSSSTGFYKRLFWIFVLLSLAISQLSIGAYWMSINRTGALPFIIVGAAALIPGIYFGRSLWSELAANRRRLSNGWEIDGDIII